MRPPLPTDGKLLVRNGQALACVDQKQGPPGAAGPSVAGGKVFIIDHQGQQDVVHCLNLQDGRELWRFAFDDPAGAEHGWAHPTPVVGACLIVVDGG